MATSSASVIHTGTQIATKPSDVKNSAAKTYKHMIPGARYILPDGLEIVFLGGMFRTSDPAHIAELDAVADKASSMIYTAAPGDGYDNPAKEVQEAAAVASASR